MMKGIRLLAYALVVAGLMGCSSVVTPAPVPTVLVPIATSAPATPTTVAEGPTASIPTATPPVATSVPQKSGGTATRPSTGVTQPTPHGDGNCTYKATFVADVSVPDNTVILGGTSFTKVWRVRNDGTCTWGSGGFALHSLVMTGGNMGGPAGTVEIPNPTINQGDVVDLAVPLTAPTNPGLYRSEWKMRLDDGTLLAVGANGTVPLYAQIIVPSNVPTPAPTGTRITFSPGATQAVIIGSLQAGEREDYRLTALQGQAMILNFTSPTSGHLQLTVFGPGQLLPQPVRTSPDGGTWIGILPVTGDYIIRVTAPNAASGFTLNITIPQRITFLPGNIAGTVTGRTADRRVVSYVLRAMQGQNMSVSIASSVRHAADLSIYGLSDGLALIRAINGATSFQGQLPANQDYVIEIVPAIDAPFSFTVTTVVQ